MAKGWKTQIELRLPYPPSANRLWRRFRGRQVLSPEAVAYRQAVAGVWWEEKIQRCWQPIGKQTCRVILTAYPPDQRHRDLDNLIKPLLDALEYAGIIENDRQVADLTIRWGAAGLKNQVGHVHLQLQTKAVGPHSQKAKTKANK